MTNDEAQITKQIRNSIRHCQHRKEASKERHHSMKTSTPLLNRREFAKTSLLAGAAVASGAAALGQETKRIRTGIIGCGSVSGSYLPVLTKCPYVEVVSLCDIRPEPARNRAEKFKIA